MSVELSKMASHMAEAAEKMSEQQSAGTGDQAATGGNVQDHDVSKFREVMNQPSSTTAEVQQNRPLSNAGETTATNPAGTAADAQPPSMGDAILDKLQQVSKQNADMLKSVENIASSDDNISVSSMLQVQTELMKVQVTEEVETKAEGKVDQTLETLLKS